MSNRTIVELNHDFAGNIARDPDGFLRAINELLSYGVNDMDSRLRDTLQRFGVRTSPTHHHSTKAEVVLAHEGGEAEFFRGRF